ncbi:MAG TPA: PDZ domain-containing protein [Planctomycetota bacterium]|nr:PDZ domain-containing protein [Planctomycetota bacterium]
MRTAFRPILAAALTLAIPHSARAQPSPASDRAFLGLTTEPKVAGDPKSGLVVIYVFPGSAAKEMGFQVGDEIRTLNDLLITDQETFTRELRKENINARVRFQIRRGGADMRIEGRIGSLLKTMKEYQETVRKDFGGKPLPPLPGVAWWNAETKTWDEKSAALEGLRGKIGIVFSFDDCDVCLQKRYLKLSQTKGALAATPTGPRIGFAGIFYAETAGRGTREERLKAAEKFLTANPPVFPVAVAFYPGDRSTPAEREKQVLLHHHGTAILDPEGNVKFIEIQGPPEYDFGIALQKVLQELEKGAAPPQGAPGARPGGGAPGEAKPSSP